MFAQQTTNRQFAGRKLVHLLMAVLVLTSTWAKAAAESKQSHSSLLVGIGLEEYKRSRRVDLKVSQARLFQIRNRVIRTSISDPGIAEPVVVAENQFLLIGNCPGETTFVLWDDVGSILTMELHVEENHGEILSSATRLGNSIAQGLRGSKLLTDFSPTSNSLLKLKEHECINTTDEYLSLIQKRVPFRDTSPRTPSGPKEDVLNFVFPNSSIKSHDIIVESGTKTYPGPATVIDLTVSQSRAFRTRNYITRIGTSDPGLCEPIPVSPRDFIVLGKSPKKARIGVTDELGNKETIEFLINGRVGPWQTVIRTTARKILGFFKRTRIDEVAPLDVETIYLSEQKLNGIVDLKSRQSRFFNAEERTVRGYVTDPKIAQLAIVSETEFALVGLAPGSTTVFLWGDKGGCVGLELKVGGSGSSSLAIPAVTMRKPDIGRTRVLSRGSDIGLHQVEVWTGSLKDIYETFPSKDEARHCAYSRMDGGVSHVELNNEGVKALNKCDFEIAIQKLNASLRMYPSYKIGIQNLAIAHNNLGLSMQESPKEAIKQFHKAVYLDPDNQISVLNLDGVVNRLGRDPADFEHRVELGDYAKSVGDECGAIVEYRAALKIRENAEVRSQLDSLMAKMRE